MELWKQKPSGFSSENIKYLSDNLYTSFPERFFFVFCRYYFWDSGFKESRSGAFKVLVFTYGEYAMRILEVATSFSEAESLKNLTNEQSIEIIELIE